MLDLFIALWAIGSIFGVGFTISRRKRSQPYWGLLLVYPLVFSWAYLGWVLGEMINLAFQMLHGRLPEKE